MQVLIICSLQSRRIHANHDPSRIRTYGRAQILLRLKLAHFSLEDIWHPSSNTKPLPPPDSYVSFPSVSLIAGILIDYYLSVLEMSILVLCILTLLILAEEYQVWAGFNNAMKFSDEQATANLVPIQSSIINGLRASVWLSAIQTILALATLVASGKNQQNGILRRTSNEMQQTR